MKRLFSKNGQQSEVVYIESLNRLLTDGYFDDLASYGAVLFVSTQTCYEVYYERFSSLFQEIDQFQWYICPNHSSVNHLDTYQDILSFSEEMKLPHGTMIVGLGDAPIYHICGFLKVTSIYLTNFLYVPTTLTGFIHALTGEAFLLNKQLKVCVQQKSLPERIVYDTMLYEMETSYSWEDDFFTLVKVGMTLDKELMRQLFAIKEKKSVSFSAYTETLMSLIEINSYKSYLFGLSFTTSFYSLSESHYLKQRQKKYVGFLLHLFWSSAYNKFSIDANMFVHWFETVFSETMILPEQMVTYDLAEVIVKELDRYETVACLNQVGEISYVKPPSLEEVYEVIAYYKNR